MKALLLITALVILSSCVMGRMTIYVPGGRYVVTLTVFE